MTSLYVSKATGSTCVLVLSILGRGGTTNDAISLIPARRCRESSGVVVNRSLSIRPQPSVIPSPPSSLLSLSLPQMQGGRELREGAGAHSLDKIV